MSLASLDRPGDAGPEGNDGVFVVLEGIDGAGTTTQADVLARYLRGKKRLVHVTREPSGDAPPRFGLDLKLPGAAP